MKILLDMNIPLKYATILAKKGFETLRWSDVGAPNASDEEIMEYASENKYIVLTFDLDFSAILSATHKSRPSVVQIRASLNKTERAVELLTIALSQNKNALNEGAILSIDLNKSRLRLLPL